MWTKAIMIMLVLRCHFSDNILKMKAGNDEVGFDETSGVSITDDMLCAGGQEGKDSCGVINIIIIVIITIIIVVIITIVIIIPTVSTSPHLIIGIMISVVHITNQYGCHQPKLSSPSSLHC